MNITQMTNFVKGSGPFWGKLSRFQILFYTLGLTFFALMSAIFLRMFGTPVARACSVTLCVLSALSIVCLIISLIKPLALKTRVFYFSSVSTLLALTFLLDSAVLCDVAGIPYYGLVYVIPPLLAIFSIYIARPKPPQRGSKKGRKKVQKKASAAIWIVPTITVGGSGFWLGRVLHPAFAQLEQPVLYVIGAILLYGLGCLLSLCSFGYLYLYYIMVLESKGVKLDD